MSGEQRLTPDDVAKRLGVSRRTIYRAINEADGADRLRAERAGARGWRITEAELERWLGRSHQ